MLDERYGAIFGTGAGDNTRFAWNAKDPRLAKYFSGYYPAYLHCQLRVCFKEDNYTNSDETSGITCPGMCDYGVPDSKWDDDIGYEPLTLHVVGGPYFLSSTNAVDLTRIREVKENFETERKRSFLSKEHKISQHRTFTLQVVTYNVSC